MGPSNPSTAKPGGRACKPSSEEQGLPMASWVPPHEGRGLTRDRPLMVQASLAPEVQPGEKLPCARGAGAATRLWVEGLTFFVAVRGKRHFCGQE